MIYAIGKFIFFVYFKLFYRYKVYGRENLPAEGGCIVCANHISYADPILVGISINRKIHFMGKEELFQNPFFAWVLRQLCVFPVNRKSVSMKTMKSAVGLLEEGKVMGIFAQGTRMAEDDIKGAKAGVALFALKGGVPVVPVGIKAKFRPFSRVEVHIGKPVTLEKYREMKLRSDVLQGATEEIMEGIRLCLEGEGLE